MTDNGPGNHHMESPRIYPRLEAILICYPSSASVSHTYGFYGSLESLMPGKDPCHVRQLACGPCFLTSFLPTLFQRTGPGSHFIQPYLREHFLNIVCASNRKRNVIRIQHLSNTHWILCLEISIIETHFFFFFLVNTLTSFGIQMPLGTNSSTLKY